MAVAPGAHPWVAMMRQLIANGAMPNSGPLAQFLQPQQRGVNMSPVDRQHYQRQAMMRMANPDLEQMPWVSQGGPAHPGGMVPYQPQQSYGGGGNTGFVPPWMRQGQGQQPQQYGIGQYEQRQFAPQQGRLNMRQPGMSQRMGGQYPNLERMPRILPGGAPGGGMHPYQPNQPYQPQGGMQRIAPRPMPRGQPNQRMYLQ